jgi:hypothetical protein
LSSQSLFVMFQRDDVEAEEAEIHPVTHGRHHRDRFVVQCAQQKTLWVSSMERQRIVPPRIPPFPRSPLDGQRELIQAHGADGEAGG